MKLFKMKEYYPKTQDALHKLLKQLSFHDFEIDFEDQDEIQGTICEIQGDEHGPRFRYIAIVKPGRLQQELVAPIIQSDRPKIYCKTFECMSCYRKIDTWIEEIEEDGGFVCIKGKLEPTTRVIVKYYDCCYCKTKLKYVENEYTKEFIDANRRFKLAEQKNVYKMKQQGDKFSNCTPTVNTLFDLWGDFDLIRLFIGENEFVVEKRSLWEYINVNVIEKGCYVECRTDDHEKLRVTAKDLV